MENIRMKTWVFAFIAFRIWLNGAEEYFILPTAWYYIRSFGQTQIFLGIVLSAYSFSSALSGPIIGRLADRFGHIKRIIVCCYILQSFGYVIYSVRLSAYFPLVGRFLAGVAGGSTGALYGQIALCSNDEYRAKIFVFLDGLYALSTVFGPTVSSIVTFNVDVLGWKIDAGNSPGIIMALMALFSLLVALFLPERFGYDEKSKEKPITFSDEDESVPPPMQSINKGARHWSTVYCIFYLVFFTLFYSSVVTFYTPILALQHFHIQFIHVKLLFVVSSLFGLALFLFLYVAVEYFNERQLLPLLMLMQTVPISILIYFAFWWSNSSSADAYFLIVYVSLGMSSFPFSLGSSILSKITDPRDAAFYQTCSFTAVHLAFLTGRIISSFIFSETSLLFFCLFLTLSWLVGAFWFGTEYKNLVSLP